jgi:hypothetical protein
MDIYSSSPNGISQQDPDPWSLCCSLIILKMWSQEWSVCNLGPKHPAVIRLDAISELAQLTNTYAGRRVRKRLNT